MSTERPLFTVVHEYDDDLVDARGNDIVAKADLDATFNAYGFNTFWLPRRQSNTPGAKFYAETSRELTNTTTEELIAQTTGILTLWLCDGGVNNAVLQSAHISAPPILSESMTDQARAIEHAIKQSLTQFDSLEILDDFGF